MFSFIVTKVFLMVHFLWNNSLKILINFKTQNIQNLFLNKYIIHFIGRWIIRYSILVHICLLISQEISINEMKERVTVMHIENFTKLLFQVILWTFIFKRGYLLLILPLKNFRLNSWPVSYILFILFLVNFWYGSNKTLLKVIQENTKL